MDRAPSHAEVAPGLHVGEHPARAGQLDEVLAYYRALGIGGVISVCDAGLDAAALTAAGLRGLHLHVTDYDAPDPDQLDDGVAFIRALRKAKQGVLVHCFAGIGRSATVACAYLIAEGADPAEAIAQVRKARSPFCVESGSQRAALLDYGRKFGR